ncbi:MAG: AAA family ATPase [Dysgonamonadaceae bacterium]|nr:AAA family ATPase [Dysgonamonadaceae bacterium]
MKNLPGSIYYLLRETAEELKIDYILVDLNPSLSALNQDFIISSDYFIIPLSTDYFSLMAIESIDRVLPQWEHWAKNARKVFNDSIYPLPKQTPKFLGYTNNDFTTNKNKPAKAYTEMFDKIKKTVTDELAPNLKVQDMLLSPDKYPNGYCLANTGYFQTLQARYQEFGVPVFALSNQQIDNTGKLLQDLNNRQRVFDDEYSNFADKVLKITSDE